MWLFNPLYISQPLIASSKMRVKKGVGGRAEAKMSKSTDPDVNEQWKSKQLESHPEHGKIITFCLCL